MVPIYFRWLLHPDQSTCLTYKALDIGVLTDCILMKIPSNFLHRAPEVSTNYQADHVGCFSLNKGIIIMKKELTLWLVAGAILGTSALASFAHGGATGIVKERMDGMAIMGGAIKAISGMLRSGTYDAQLVENGAEAILQHSGETLTALFPKGSDAAPTKAKPEVWTNWDEFSDLAGQLGVLAAALKANAAMPLDTQSTTNGMMGGDMMGGGMGAGAMGGDAAMPTREMLAQMPPDRLFDMVVRTCASCHTKYRIED